MADEQATAVTAAEAGEVVQVVTKEMQRLTVRGHARIVQARTNLLLDHPFFGTLALRLKVVSDYGQPTCYTDGRVLGFNPSFVENLNDLELIGVVAHEVWHCACGHTWRRDGREPRKWNVAADFAINSVIEKAGMTLPADALRNPAWDGMSAEYIYSVLPEQPQGKGQGGDGSGGYGPQFGDVRDASADGSGNAEMATDWQIATRQAAQAAKMQGKLPGHLQGIIDEMLRPVINWRAILRRFVQQCAKSDYSWAMPNKRYMGQGVYLPSLKSETCPPIMVFVDSSGSVSDEWLKQFAGEIDSIVQEVKPERTYVGYCDAAVHSVEEFEHGAQFKMNVKGRGGTSFIPPFVWVEEHMSDNPPACFIYLTDLEGPAPDSPPEYPVLWVTTEQREGPWGETVYLDPQG